MDLYQEFRRSHERVKVMLSETIDENSEKISAPPSAQENLQRFIQQHESKIFDLEQKASEQNYVNLATETLPEKSSNYSFSSINNNLPSNVSEDNFNQYTYDTKPDQISITHPSVPIYESEHPKDEIPYTAILPQNDKEPHLPVQHKKVEDELDDIIRDALNNIAPASTNPTDFDPELLKMLKKLLLKNNFTSNWQDNNFFLDVNEQNRGEAFYQDINSASSNSNPNQNSLDSNSQFQPDLRQQGKKQIASFDQHLQNQQSPPKVPIKLVTVKRPDVKEQVGVFDPSFSSMDYDDDSSLALTKNEIRMQVKTLINETLEENKQESTKPNDLLELEKQLKEHIEKIKNSRK